MKTPPSCLLALAMAFSAGGFNGVRAVTPLPVWYGEPRTTRTGYIFDNNSLSPLPNLSENPFGSPAATVTLGTVADGWQDPQIPWDNSGVLSDGAWDIGKTGVISVTVPFAPTVPPAGMYYDVAFLVRTVAYKGIMALPSFDSSVTPALDLVLSQATVAQDPMFSGATWEGLTWTGHVAHVSASNLSLAIKSPANNMSVVDTYEVFTQYTWHASDPLARIWDGSDVDDNLWTSRDNWGGIAPVAGDTLYFAGTTRLAPVNNMVAGTSCGGITFLSDAGTFTLSGNAVTLAGNVTNLGNNLQTLRLPAMLTGERTFSTNGAAGGITVGGGISGATGGIIKTGDGVLNLTGANTYQGNTTVAAGTLALSGGGTIAGSRVIAVAAGAILDVSAVNGGLWTLGNGQILTGGGAVNGNIRIEGTYAPGSGIGAALGNGDWTYAAGSIFAYEFNSGVGVDPAYAADLHIINGDLTLSGTVVLDLADLAGWRCAFAEGTILSMINYTGELGGGHMTWEGNELTEGERFTLDANTWEISYSAQSGGLNFSGYYVGGHFVNLNLVAIPEPGSLLALGWLLGCGLFIRTHRTHP